MRQTAAVIVWWRPAANGRSCPSTAREYSFNPAWMAPYAANHYAYGYVCGLEVEEKTGGLLVDYLKNAPIDRIFYAPGPRGAGIAIERQNALYALHPILHLNGAEASTLSGLDGLDESLLFLHEKTQAPVIATLGSLGARGFNRGRRVAHRAGLSRRACGGHHRARAMRTPEPFCWGFRAGSRSRMPWHWATASARQSFKRRARRCRRETSRS